METTLYSGGYAYKQHDSGSDESLNNYNNYYDNSTLAATPASFFNHNIYSRRLSNPDIHRRHSLSLSHDDILSNDRLEQIHFDPRYRDYRHSSNHSLNSLQKEFLQQQQQQQIKSRSNSLSNIGRQNSCIRYDTPPSIHVEEYVDIDDDEEEDDGNAEVLIIPPLIVPQFHLQIGIPEITIEDGEEDQKKAENLDAVAGATVSVSVEKDKLMSTNELNNIVLNSQLDDIPFIDDCIDDVIDDIDDNSNLSNSSQTGAMTKSVASVGIMVGGSNSINNRISYRKTVSFDILPDDYIVDDLITSKNSNDEMILNKSSTYQCLMNNIPNNNDFNDNNISGTNPINTKLTTATIVTATNDNYDDSPNELEPIFKLCKIKKNNSTGSRDDTNTINTLCDDNNRCKKTDYNIFKEISGDLQRTHEFNLDIKKRENETKLRDSNKTINDHRNDRNNNNEEGKWFFLENFRKFKKSEIEVDKRKECDYKLIWSPATLKQTLNQSNTRHKINGKVKALTNYFDSLHNLHESGLYDLRAKRSLSSPDLKSCITSRETNRLSEREEEDILRQLKEWSVYGTQGKDVATTTTDNKKLICDFDMEAEIINLKSQEYGKCSKYDEIFNRIDKVDANIMKRNENVEDMSEYILCDPSNEKILPDAYILNKRRHCKLNCKNIENINIQLRNSFFNSCPNIFHAHNQQQSQSHNHTNVVSPRRRLSTNLTVRKVKKQQNLMKMLRSLNRKKSFDDEYFDRS